MPLRNLTVLLITIFFSTLCYAKAARNRYASIIAEGIMIVSEMGLEKADSRKLFENAMAGMLHDFDEHSQYIPPKLFKPLQESLDQFFGGIGIILDLEADGLTVKSALVDTPAHRAGIRPGDVILDIDGESTRGLTRDHAQIRLRGQPGTQVTLRIKHLDGIEQEMDLVREIIVVESVMGDTRDEHGHWRFVLESNPRIGYIRIENFGERTADELEKALSSIKGEVEGLIIDLRYNAGGLLRSAVLACDLFLDEGVIVTTRGRERKIRDLYDADSDVACPTEWPIAVITNRDSASASEIMAACLQDHERAVVVGERTWGKGTVQNIYPLEGGRSALKLTVASYWRPSGKNIHKSKGATEKDDWGVQPNPGLEVVYTEEQYMQTYRLRRERDVLDGDKYAGSTVASDADSSAPDSEELLTVDEQLRRAVDYIESRLKESPD